MIQLTDDTFGYNSGTMTEGNYILSNGNILTISKKAVMADYTIYYSLILKVLKKDDLSILFNKEITLRGISVYNNYNYNHDFQHKLFIKSNRIYIATVCISNNTSYYYFDGYVLDYSLNTLGSVSPSAIYGTPGKNFIIGRSVSGLPTGSIFMFFGTTKIAFINDSVSYGTETNTDVINFLTNNKSSFFECHGDTFSSNTVGQYLEGAGGLRSLSSKGFYLFLLSSSTTSVVNKAYVDVSTGMVMNARNSCIVKGYNGKTFIIYKTALGGVRYKEWNTLNNTLGTEYTLVADGLLTDNLILSDTTKFVSQIKINTTQILVAITTKNGFTQTVLSQDPSTNILTVFKDDINLAGFTEIGDRNSFVGVGQKIGNLGHTTANTMSYIDTVTFTMGGNEFFGDNEFIGQSGSCGVIYDYMPDILKGQVEYSFSSENKIYNSKKTVYDTYFKYDSFLQIINFNEPVYQNSYFESINFDTTGMKSFKFEATQSVPTGCSIEWSYSVNNGVSFASLTNGGTISAEANKLKLKAVLNTNGDNSVKINSYKVTVYK